MKPKFARTGLALAAIDLLAALFAISYRTPPKQNSAVPTYGKFAFTISWPAKCDADEDIYIRDPAGKIVYYDARENTAMHLENDTIPTEAAYARGNPNFERVVVRQVVPGEYTFNVHTYDDYDCKATVVRAQLWKLQGDDTLVYQREVQMRGWGAERTAFRVTLHADDSTSGINVLYRSLVR